jgi:hypothetical protein
LSTSGNCMHSVKHIHEAQRVQLSELSGGGLKRSVKCGICK